MNEINIVSIFLLFAPVFVIFVVYLVSKPKNKSTSSLLFFATSLVLVCGFFALLIPDLQIILKGFQDSNSQEILLIKSKIDSVGNEKELKLLKEELKKSIDEKKELKEAYQYWGFSLIIILFGLNIASNLTSSAILKDGTTVLRYEVPRKILQRMNRIEDSIKFSLLMNVVVVVLLFILVFR